MAGAPAQQFVALETIREGAVVLKDGGLRAVLMCSSLNFALKSAEEQDAIIFKYQDFLNSLDFSIQFVIHSRRLNVAPYLDTLQSRQREEENELLKIQISEYIDFIKSFVEMTNIVSKTFYVVVPFSPAIIGGRGIITSLRSALRSQPKVTQRAAESFEESENQLWQRVDSIVAGLKEMGIRSAPLNTEELVELFYGLYNPSEFEKITEAV